MAASLGQVAFEVSAAAEESCQSRGGNSWRLGGELEEEVEPCVPEARGTAARDSGEPVSLAASRRVREGRASGSREGWQRQPWSGRRGWE